MPIAYLGKIRCGIYLFHFFVPLALGASAARIGIEYADGGTMTFVVSSLATSALAAVSWELVEGRVNGLKRHFPYREHRQQRSEPAAIPVPATQAMEP